MPVWRLCPSTRQTPLGLLRSTVNCYIDVFYQTEDFVALKGAGVLLTVQRVEDYLPPVWPSGPVPKQLHLELAVDDLDAAEATALALGVRKAEEQPAPNR